MTARTELRLGDPIVVAGDKYRLRNFFVDYGVYALAKAPARNPTHILYSDSAPEWDARVGVWRASGRLGIHPSRLP